MKFKPSSEFSKKAKERFLVAFDARYPATVPARRFRFAWVLKTAVGTFAVIAILLGGASVYADTKNVPADSVLYPLKRLSETVQLAVTPTNEKADLQATFAEKRVAEMNDLAERKPSSTIITNLMNDADTAVNASITAADKTNIQDGKLSDLCGRLLTTVATSSATFKGEMLGHANILEHFTDRCETAGNGGDSHGGNTATTTPTTTPNLELRIHNYLFRNFPVATTTATTTATDTNVLDGRSKGKNLETVPVRPSRSFDHSSGRDGRMNNTSTGASATTTVQSLLEL